MRIIIDTAENGLIQTIIDNNYDGAGKTFEQKKIFTIEDNIEHTEKFIKTLIEDLGLYTGGVSEKYNLVIGKDFGPQYTLDKSEASTERKKLAMKLSKLKTI